LDDLFSAVLTGPRVVLRPYSEERDFLNVVSMFSDPAVTSPIGILHPRPFMDGLKNAKRERMACRETADWTVFVRSADNGEHFVGEVGIGSWDPETQVFELFAAIVSEQTGKAYGCEAVSVLMTRIFLSYPHATVRMQTLLSNQKAIGLCLKLGYRESGRRFTEPDWGIGFTGGMAIIMDCRASQFKPFVLSLNKKH
jgi:RimJ/RimL family protein N-acetyltransferase